MRKSKAREYDDERFEAQGEGRTAMMNVRFNLIKLHRQHKGQAMAEFCVAAPVLVLLLWSILYLTDMFIVKHETLVAARYGTWLLARNDDLPGNSMDIDQVRALIKRNFFRNRSQNLLVEEQHVEDDLAESLQSYWEDPTSGFISWAIHYFEENIFHSGAPRFYSLNVQYDYPRLFGAVDLRDGNNRYFEIQSRHFVLGNSWDGQRVEVHDLKDMLEELLDDLVDGIIDAGEEALSLL